MRADDPRGDAGDLGRDPKRPRTGAGRLRKAFHEAEAELEIRLCYPTPADPAAHIEAKWPRFGPPFAAKDHLFSIWRCDGAGVVLEGEATGNVTPEEVSRAILLAPLFGEAAR